MDVGIISIILIVVLVILLGLGTPIAFCVGFLTVVGILAFLDPAWLSRCTVGYQAVAVES